MSGSLSPTPARPAQAPPHASPAPLPAQARPALTVSRRHLFSLMAPMQPTKPMAMMKVPVTMSRLAADRDGKEEDRVAKFPCVAASQMPTPRIPHPPSWAEGQGRGMVRQQQGRPGKPACTSRAPSRSCPDTPIHGHRDGQQGPTPGLGHTGWGEALV